MPYKHVVSGRAFDISESRECGWFSPAHWKEFIEFLKYLGLSKPEDLPDFAKLNRNNNLDKLLSEMGSSNLSVNEMVNKAEISE